jgi:uncharacterized protein YgiM (DUF1202 family)
MRSVVRLVLSLEKFVNNPLEWFGQQAWLLRIMLPVILIIAISATSIFGYQKMSQFKNQASDAAGSVAAGTNVDTQNLEVEIKKLHDSQIKEILSLRQDIAKLQRLVKNSDEVDLTEDDSQQVLGELQETNDPNSVEKETKLVLLVVDEDEAPVYAQPTNTSKKVASFQPDIFYFYVLEKNDWVQIDLGDKKTGWIEKKFVIILPINETY